MIKIYQTVVDKNHGNCTQAVVASLLNLPLEEVPNFIEIKDGTWFEEVWNICKKHGHNPPTCFDINKHGWDYEKQVKLLEHDNGINGFFHASVLSQTFDDGTTHSVIVDTKLNVVHDPNPNQLALKLKSKDIIQVWVHKNDWYIDTDGKLVIKEFCTCGNPSNEGEIFLERDEDLTYICLDCRKQAAPGQYS